MSVAGAQLAEGGGVGRGDGQGWLTPAACLPESYMTSRTVRETSGLLSLTSTLYLRLHKPDQNALFHCSAHYRLPKGQRGRLDSPSFSLTLHCESTQAPVSPTLDCAPHCSLTLQAHLWPHTPLWPLISLPYAGMCADC